MRKNENVKVLNYFVELSERIKRDKKTKEELFNNYDYINWLEKFTLTNEFFRLDHLIYDAHKLSKQDWDNAQKLNLFFEGIEEYATEKGIEPENCGSGPVYAVKHNGIGYYVAVMAGQGVTNSCMRTEIDEDSVFIDFSDIVNNKNKIYKHKKSI